LPPLLATLVAIGLYTLLPERLVVGPHYVVAIIGVLLLITVLVTDPRRVDRKSRTSGVAQLALTLLISVANLLALVLLLHELVTGRGSGPALLLASLQVWATNVVAFALVFWQLDRGGPVRRHTQPRADLRLADFRFTQDEDGDTVEEVARGSSQHSDWRPAFVDYLYVSTTNSSAYSPTDTMPLSHRAKMLMAVQATEALIVAVVVIAKGVSGLG